MPEKKPIVLSKLARRLTLTLLCAATLPLRSPAQTLPVTNGLQLWLKADAGITTNATGAVTTWADQSGLGNHATQANPALAPTAALNSLNGKPTLRFGGGSSYLDVANSASISSLTQDVTILTLVKFDEVSGGYRCAVAKTLGKLPAPFDWYTVGSGGGRTIFYVGNGSQYINFLSAAPPPVGFYNVMGVSWGNGIATQYLNDFNNGHAHYTITPGDGGGPLRLGSRDDLSTQLKGSLAEVLIYQPALSDSNRMAVIEYLRAKYALVFNLPPTARIQTPTSGLTVAAQADLSVSIHASDPDGTVARVDLLYNGECVTSLTNPPYTIKLPSFLQPGEAVLTAVAVDNQGRPTTSAPVSLTVVGATLYRFDASSVSREIRTGLLKMGANKDPQGHEISANSYFFTRDGKPWLPVMGEMHYARYPRVQWEQEILKMKAGGIQIVATHPLWVHHEEIEGQCDWSGDLDLREFVKLCAKHGLYSWVKIGGNGDCRGNGLPDWLLTKTAKVRSHDPVYMKYARRFYEEVCKQCAGLYFKDGGPIIGVQLDNEVQGDDYMLTLKRYAREFGCDVPFYSATGWGMKLPLDEFLLVFGAYPDAPWTPGCYPLSPNTQYLFPSSLFDNSYDYQIATKPENLDKTFWFTTDRCPFTTAEVTGGNQMRYNRRPFFCAEDITAIAYTMLGKGVNLLGYYMYHGGSNPMGKLTSMEEAGYPVISYDFEGALGEFGRPQEWYHSLRLLHLFMHDFGDRLAPALPVLPSRQPTASADADTLRSIVRVKDDSGFLFLNNHHYLVQMKDLGPMQFEVKLKSETLTLPERPVKIEQDVYAIWPINFSVGSAMLKYATAQPICKVNTDNGTHYFFFAPRGMAPEYVFAGSTVASIAADGAKVVKSNECIRVSGLEPGAGCVFTVKTATGESVRISTLTYAQAMRCWKASIWGGERVFLSDDSNLLFDHDRLEIHSPGRENFSFAVCPPISGSLAVGSGSLGAPQPEGVFTRYAVKVPRKDIPVDFKVAFQNKPAPKSNPLSGVNWIWSEQGQYNGFGHVRKKFTIPAGAKIKSAQFFFAVDDTLLLWVNGYEVRADPESTPPNHTGGWGHVTRIDISRFLTPGTNLIAGKVVNCGHAAGFAAKGVVEFEDGPSLTFATNEPWLFAREEPSDWTAPGFDDSSWKPAVVICPVGGGAWGMPDDAPCWVGAVATISLPPDSLAGLNDLFLNIDYAGNTARLFYNGQLIADDLYHGHPSWMVGLRRFAPMISNSLGRTLNTTFMQRDISLEISPLKKDAPICMPASSWPKFTSDQIAEIRSITAVPEYKVIVTR